MSALLIMPTCAPADEWDGPKLKPVAREEIFEFTKKPVVRKTGQDGYEISFAVRGRCDVAVTIEDARGKVIRHLVYGVLGPNAPERLKKDSLEQTVTWDGKDDAGKYVEAIEGLRVRVSLGLKPEFERLLGWHPKDIDSSRRVSAMAADKDGVYVLSGGERPQLRAYNHDGSYLRTLVPFRADKLEEFKRGDLRDLIKLHDGEVVYYPAGGHAAKDGGAGGARGNHFNLSFDGEATPTISQRMACAAGKLAVASMGGLVPKQVMRIRTDGSPEGGRLYGPVIGKAKARKWMASLVFNHALASSPDGKWLYLTGLRNGTSGPSGVDRVQFIPAVYRMEWDAEVMPELPFLGEIEYPRDDHKGFNVPTCVATDAGGNLYVADSGNDRIQVFKPDGEHLQTVKLKAPAWIDVDQKTGALYAIAQMVPRKGYEGGWRFHLVKISPLPDAKMVIDKEFDYGPAANDPVFCIDGWTAPPTVWITHRHGEVALYEDRGDSFALKHEFIAEVKKAGQLPFYLSSGCRHCLSADLTRGHLYLNGEVRFNPVTGECAPVKLPNVGGELDEFLIGPDGLAYLRTMKYILRFNPETWQSVPFDYGEEVQGGWGFRVPGGLRFPWPYVFHCQTGFGVSPRGDVMVLGLYSRATIQEGRLSLGNDWAMEGFRKGLMRKVADGEFQPKFYPGRPGMNEQGNILGIWDRKGEERLLDAVGGLYCGTCGVRGDREGNIYLGFSGNKMVDGKPLFGDSLVKFGPGGGKFIYEKGGTVPLKDPPDRPSEFRARGNPAGNVWTRGQLLWSYGGINEVGSNTSCFCPQMRFDVDLFGRVFTPEAHHCSVAVLDTNGNPVLRLGRYGNADSGRGPDSPLKVGGPEIALAYCSYLAVDSGRGRLYLADSGNNRIVSVKLTYQVEELVLLKGEGAAP